MGKQKVGIMTWVNYYNYGSLLQATALQTVVERVQNVKVINYLPNDNNISYFNMDILPKIINKAKKILKHNLNGDYVSDKRKASFDNYKSKYINLTNKCIDVSDLVNLNKEFDTFIAGSDQIWAPTCFNDYYFLNFVSDNKKKIAYAPSIGINKIDNPYLEYLYPKYLSRFDALSVREQESVDLLKNKFNIDAKLVLDPTLLMNKEEWISKLEIEETNENYLLVYFLGQNEKYFKLVEKLAKDLGLPIKIIPTHKEDYDRGYSYIDDASPREFVELIANASYICTDSFHGTAFSLIFNKQFSVFKRFKDTEKNCQNSRIYNILDIIQDRSPLVRNDIVETHIDYNNVNNLLQQARESSIKYLYDSLEAEKENTRFYITDNCTGCGVCKEVCPKQAISVIRNTKGFYEAKIDNTLCVKCGLCQKICANNNRQTALVYDCNAYSYKAENEVLSRSSSGGIAYKIAEKCSKQGYAVYGCAMENDNVYHAIALPNDFDTLHSFQGSKYLQSDFNTNLSKLLSINGNKVVFGTPCQIAGLNNLLLQRNERDKYLLVDLICHGVPSYNLWLKFKQYIKDKYSIEDAKILFRDKEAGWQAMAMSIKSREKRIVKTEDENMFYYFFNTMSCYNESCYNCNYRDKSSADIRIGDFWGKKFKEDKTGVSIALPFTNKGLKVLEELGCVKQDLNDYLSVQQTVNYFEPVYYDMLINDLGCDNINIETIYSKYLKKVIRERKIYRIYSKVKRIIKK